jgi:hypothetical protein
LRTVERRDPAPQLAPQLDAPRSAADAGAAPLHAACLNCETPLAGPYCSQCGQRDRRPHPSLREVVHEAWEEFVNVDGRLLTTLRVLLTRPGTLTLDLVSGRRARYVGPLRLYLLCSVAYFVGSAVLPDRVRDARLRARAAAARPEAPLPASCTGRTTDASRVVRALRQLDCKSDRNPVAFETARRTNVPRLMFVLVPLFAAISAVAFRGRTYPEHLYFALHLHAIAFLALLVTEAAARLPWQPVRSSIRFAMLLAVAGYTAVAVRRVHEGRWGVLLVRTFGVAVAYLLAFMLGMTALLVLTAYRM